MQSFPNDVLSELRRHLEEEKQKTVKRIAELAAQDPFSDPERTHENNAASDREASQESSHDRFAALLEEEQKRLADIDNALIRVADSTYGFCSNCGLLIDTDRLSVLPTATLCLACERTKRKTNGYPHSL